MFPTFSLLNPSIEESASKPEKKNWKSFKQTKQEFERRKKQAEKRQKRDEQRQRFLEKQEAIKVYRQKKAEKNKILNRKNKRGQPVMAGRMEMLLEKIKAQTG